MKFLICKTKRLRFLGKFCLEFEKAGSRMSSSILGMAFLKLVSRKAESEDKIVKNYIEKMRHLNK